jgi:uncharacterized MnhB-related membrane protein
MRRKIGNAIVGLLFILFAVVQLNDPDPLKWVIIYGFVAAIAFWYAFGHLPKNIALGGAVIGLVWLAFLVPDLIDWIQRGMPSITESMKAEKQYVELTREFFGLLVSVVTLLLYYFNAKRKD